MAKIYLSPSDQFGNKYAYGNTNENAQCERIAEACETALLRCGFEVKNNKSSSMESRVYESNEWGADLHVPIHTNAYNGRVTGTRLFCWDKSGAGYKASKNIFDNLAPLTPGTSENISVDTTLYEVRNANAPTTYIEVDFHDFPTVAKWIIENVEPIGEAICKGICEHFGVEYVNPVREKYRIVLGEYETKDDAEAAIGQVYALLRTAQEALVTLSADLQNATVTNK